MLLTIFIFGTVGALCARGLWQVCMILFGPLARDYPPRPEGCPGRPEGWA